MAAEQENEGEGEEGNEKGKAKTGPKPRSILDNVRSRAWVADLKRRTNTKTYAALDRALFGETDTKRTWHHYMSGNRKPDQTARLVETRPVGLGSSRVLEIGPMEDGVNIPLWRLFEERAHFAEYLDEILADIGIMRGACSCTEFVLGLFAEPAAWAVARNQSMPSWPDGNAIDASAESGYFTPTLSRFAAAIAGWRCAMVDRTDVKLLELLLASLIDGPAKTILDQHGIREGIRDLIGAVAIEYHLGLLDLQSAVKVRNQFGLTPSPS